ncbi:MAG: hypothetical protein IJ087_15635 [Eggerthellaceae bacterium]|nr:hypothetical protein [Eggerthellaceae bacterium]
MLSRRVECTSKAATQRNARSRRSLLAVIVAVLCVLALVALPSCKYSDVLTQHTEDPELGAVDENAEPNYESNPNSDLVLDMMELSIDESDDVDTQVAMLPHYDPNAPDNGPTKQRIKSNQTPHDEEASEGEEEGEPDRTGTGEGAQGGETGATTGEGEGQDEGSGEEQTSDEAEDPSDASDTGGGGGTTVEVGDGTDAETAKGTVAAVGEYATIAQMLGGAGALAGCDESWLAARDADGCFEGELDRVQVAFAGDGTEESCCDVDALINTIQPSVVLWDGTSPNLSESDRSALEAAGITVQNVPTIGKQSTEDYAVTQSVQAVASVLSGASGLEYDPIGVATQYVSFHDQVLQAAYDANGGYSYKVSDGSYAYVYQDTPLSGLSNSVTTRIATAYIDDLMKPSVSSAKVSQNAAVSDGMIELAHNGQTLDVSDGVGLSSSGNPGGYLLIDYYLQLAGVVNNAYDTPKPEPQGRPYILMPGTTTAFGTSTTYASRSTGSAFFYNAGDGTVRANWHALGDADFPAVITATDEIAQAIASSASKADGLYRMDGSYRIMVVPTGVAGSWAAGHIDSYLMSLWAYGIRDASQLATASEYVEAFYRDYLRCPNWQDAVSNWDTSYTAKSG